MNGVEQLRELLQERILVFDGAMGTQIQARNLSAADFGGECYEGCNEHLVLTRPDVIRSIHRAYLDAGADIIETNTFGATPLVLAEYDLADQAFEINRRAAQIARESIEEGAYATPRFVAGSMGPTTKSLCVTGGITFDQLVEHYRVQAAGLISGGVDLLLLETGQDTLNIKAGLQGIWLAMEQSSIGREDLPIMVSGTIEPMGTMLAGQSAESLHTSLEHANIFALGLNCATGPDAMKVHMQAISSMSPYYISCMPNAGLPDEDGNYNETPQTLAAKLGLFCGQGLVNFIGGCCGTTPAHIAELALVAKKYAPRKPAAGLVAACAGVDYVNIAESRPLIIGERTNVIGSRAFKKLITENEFEQASEIARKQVRGGAHVIDVCLANPDRNEHEDMAAFLERAMKIVRAPIMIDSTDAEVIEEALKRIQGKAIINSVNLEDGEERFAQICPLVKKFGASLVVGCIDEDPEQGMAVTVERKVAIAQRSFEILTTKYGIPPRDIIFDPLVFPCGTGDQQYIGSAKQTIDGVRAIKQALPECFTILGISNVSFGLPAEGREVMNTVFLHKNLEAGLDMAIVNAEKLQRITHISAEDIAKCEALIEASADNYDATLAAFVSHFRQRKASSESRDDQAHFSVEERLSHAVVDGSKLNLIANLDEARLKYDPLDIINGPLMQGMEKVGVLFGNNQLIVAEVLQSAEVMKASVNHLEQFMNRPAEAQKGKMLLATVKGDVHDIGKNLVDIIFSNNGYKVINLGIKVLPQTIIAAAQEHSPDIIGLSGLLVRSAQEMVSTVQAIKDAGINTPVIVGGAALSEQFTYAKIAPSHSGLVCYAKDAMSGLALANQIVNADQRAGITAQIEQSKDKARRRELEKQNTHALGTATKLHISHDGPIPSPPDTAMHVVTDIPIDSIWSFINPSMLYTRHLGLKGKLRDLLAKNDEKAVSLVKEVKAVEDIILKEGLLSCKAQYQFWRAVSENDKLILLDNKNQERALFAFPRQTEHDLLCLSDFAPPRSSGIIDHVGVMITSCQGVREPIRILADKWKEEGKFLHSHILLSIAIESAEACAEWLHQKIRAMWGCADPSSISMSELFSARYHGRRYSFGYPACPELQLQEELWRLMEPQKHINVVLTPEYMMDPESSVSALVFHHPQAKYFSV